MKLEVDLTELHFSAMKMIIGQVVTIYQKPMSEDEPEGEAELIEFKAFDPDTNLYTWNVKFLEDDRVLERKILIKN